MKTPLVLVHLSGWRRYGLLGLMVMLLASGCDGIPRRQSQAGPTANTLPLDFRAALPAGWEPLEGWRTINIDGDVAEEYLLFFRFDDVQIGAAIFDIQIPTDLVGLAEVVKSNVVTGTPAPLSLQSLGAYLPYRLLPSYWDFSYGGGVAGGVGHGVIAPPATAAAHIHHSVVLHAEADPPHEELVIRGGGSHLTFVWWKGKSDGYGVSQLVAPGGFSGIDWAAWEAAPTPILSLSGLMPLDDYRAHSGLCRGVAYTRRVHSAPDGGVKTESAPELPVAGVAFDAADEGIRFCAENIPQHPYYPEGVVLAYLLGPRPSMSGLENLLAPGVTLAQLDADAAFVQLAQSRVTDLATFPTVPVELRALRSGEFAPTTLVCAELTGAGDHATVRHVLFTLRYLPPDLESRLPDRWVLAGAQEAPPPPGRSSSAYCAALLAGVS